MALLGISVGDLFSPDVIDTVSDYLERIPLVAARDTGSAARLTELGARKVLTIGDLALEALDGPPPTAHPVNERPRIGVVFREILGRGRDVPETTNERLQGELAAALDRLVAGVGARVELIPFRTRGTRPLTRRRRPSPARPSPRRRRPGVDWTRHPRPRSAAEFARLAAGLDLIIAVRLHGAVLGTAAGRPVVGIAYDAEDDRATSRTSAWPSRRSA